MTTMVGREVWWDDGMLRHGRVTNQEFDPDICTVLFDSGGSKRVGSSSLILTLDEAISNCLDSVAYWRRQADALTERKEKGKNK